MRTRLIAAAAAIAATAIPLLPVIEAPGVSAVTCTVTARLSPGMTHPDVKCLEQRLAELGYNVGPPDNVYDNFTYAAVGHFQSVRGLYVDGIVTSVAARQLGLRGPVPTAPSAARVTVIGDSTSAAMRWYDEATNTTSIYDVMGTSYDLLWSVESCRRLVAPSCIGRTDPGVGLKWRPVSVLPLMQTSLKGQLGQALVIMAGYDDVSIGAAIDGIMAEATAQGVSRVFWLTYRATGAYGYGPYYAAHNVRLQAAKVRYPNLTVLDWNSYSYSQPPAVQRSWFESDGIHMTRAGGTALAGFLKNAVDASDVNACLAANAGAGVPAAAPGIPTAPTAVDTGYRPVAPVRVLDTRAGGVGGGAGKLGAGRTVTIDLASSAPAGAVSAALSVAAVGPCASGFLTVYACGTRPDASNVNYVSGRTTAGLAFSLLTGTTVCVYSSAAVDLIVDLVGAFAPGGQLFQPLPPTRWIDTRGNPSVAPGLGALPGGYEFRVQIAGQGGVPDDARAAWLNLTAVSQGSAGGLLAYPGPCGAAPVASSVNVMGGRTAAAASLVGLGPDGEICLRSFGGAVHAVVDVSGWFGGAAPGGLSYRAEVASRVLDTRTRAVAPVPGLDWGLPTDVVSVYNVAAVASSGPGFVSAKPCAVTAVSSLLNTVLLETVANVGAVGPGSDGQVCLRASVPTNYVVDRIGTFTPAST
jgi:Putative peptidoglycan binding domain